MPLDEQSIGVRLFFFFHANCGFQSFSFCFKLVVHPLFINIINDC